MAQVFGHVLRSEQCRWDAGRRGSLSQEVRRQGYKRVWGEGTAGMDQCWFRPQGQVGNSHVRLEKSLRRDWVSGSKQGLFPWDNVPRYYHRPHDHENEQRPRQVRPDEETSYERRCRDRPKSGERSAGICCCPVLYQYWRFSFRPLSEGTSCQVRSRFQVNDWLHLGWDHGCLCRKGGIVWWPCPVQWGQTQEAASGCKHTRFQQVWQWHEPPESDSGTEQGIHPGALWNASWQGNRTVSRCEFHHENHLWNCRAVGAEGRHVVLLADLH